MHAIWIVAETIVTVATTVTTDQSESFQNRFSHMNAPHKLCALLFLCMFISRIFLYILASYLRIYNKFQQRALSVERTKDERSFQIRGNVVCQGESHKRLLKPMKWLSKHFSMCGKVAEGQHLEVFIWCAVCDWKMFRSDDFWLISCWVWRPWPIWGLEKPHSGDALQGKRRHLARKSVSGSPLKDLAI